MQRNLSRMEHREKVAREAATKGEWEIKTRLFSSEIRRIIKQWHATITILEDQNQRGEFPCKIDWRRAFEEQGINSNQSLFISHIIDEIPSVDPITGQLILSEMPKVENFAQELFLRAARA